MRALSILAMLILAPASLAAGQERGWHTYDLGDGRRATRFLPSMARTCDPQPLVLFLHGAGGTPEAYHSHLASHAEELGIVLLLPQASGAGWSGADTPTIEAALVAVEADGIRVDERRTYLAGHSAGGAFAYLLAYGGSSGFAAVFSMSAPFYAVDSISDPMHRAPIHMYYGADDPNYTGGSASMLQMQWTRLGLTHETDVQVGYGHSTWPASSIRAGLAFLLASPYPGSPTPSLCDVDAGTLGGDAGPGGDAAVVPSDAGAADAMAPGVDGASSERDAGPRDGAIASGCGCRVGAPPRTSWVVVALGLVLATLARRRASHAARAEIRDPARPD